MKLRTLKLRTRIHTYSLLLGAVFGMLLAGLAIPLVFGERTEQVALTTRGGGTTFDAGPEATGDAETPTELEAATPAPAATARAASRARATATATTTGSTTGAVDELRSTATGAPITIGTLLLDLASVTRLGFDNVVASVEDQRKVWERYYAEVNSAGGINGRPLKAEYATYDALSEDTMLQACTTLTRDKKVFAAVDAAGFVGAPILCFTKENGTPFLLQGSSGVPEEYYGQSKGLLFSVFQGSGRAMRNLAWEVHTRGALKDKTIGIISDLRSNPVSVPDELEQAVEDLGYTVKRKAVFSADLAAGSGQIPVEVQQMKLALVDVILNITNALYIAQFTQEAESQQYFPDYFSGDWNGANSDFYYSNTAPSFDGSLNFTITRGAEFRANLPEQKRDAQCRESASKALGRTVTTSESNYGTFLRMCAIADSLSAGLRAMGADVTAGRLRGALGSVGRMDLPFAGGAAWLPTRFDAADHVRTMRYSSGCRCITPIDAFRATRY